MRKICYITGTRADYGLMNRTLNLAREMGLEVSVCVTGMHLLPHYGNTVEEIERDGHRITARVPVHMDGTSGASMARAISAEIAGFTTALERERPDIVLVLGDRGEMLAGAIVAVHLNIIVVHIHGGERSGTIDESVRHAISKLSHYHFVTTEGSRERLIRMGERAESITVTGAPGLDDIYQHSPIPRDELFNRYGFDRSRPLLLVVYHPVVQEAGDAGDQMTVVLQSVLNAGSQVLVLKPNADSGGYAIERAISNFSGNPDVQIITHLPRAEYISWMSAADVMLGNSSSGIIEAASLGLPVVNIGTRQNDRERNINTIDVSVDRASIEEAVRTQLTAKRVHSTNIYGDGNAAKRIVAALKEIDLSPTVLVKTNLY